MLCASVDARRGGRGYAVRNGSLPQPQPEHLSRPEARVLRLWCTQSGLCLPLSANASCGTGGWLGVGPNAAAAWVPTPPRRPPKRPPCRYPRREEASVQRPPSDAPDNALEAPSEWVPVPHVHGEPCALPHDVAAADKGLPTSRSVLRAANVALQREVGRTVRAPEVQPPPRPPPLSEWGGGLEAGLLEARNAPAVV